MHPVTGAASQGPFMTAFTAAFADLARPTALAATLLAGSILPAAADGLLTAKYVLSIGGVEIGRASVVAKASDTSFEIAGTGKITGILRAVSSGKGTVAARGTMAGGKPTPQLFAVSTDSDGKAESIRITFAGTSVKELEVEPPPKPLPDRVEVTDAHKINVIDPLSGAFVAIPGTGDMLSPTACAKAIPVFDGRQRFDITLSYLRTEPVKTETGSYEGTAVVCRVSYAPVAGHRPTRSTVKYLQANKEMFVWLVPVAGTRLMAPFRVSVATVIGTALFEATSFEATASGKTVPASAPAR